MKKAVLNIFATPTIILSKIIMTATAKNKPIIYTAGKIYKKSKQNNWREYAVRTKSFSTTDKDLFIFLVCPRTFHNPQTNIFSKLT